MYSVKRLDKNETIESIYLSDEKTLKFVTKAKVTFAVVNSDGEIVKASNGQCEIYTLKKTAQLVADWYNKS